MVPADRQHLIILTGVYSGEIPVAAGVSLAAQQYALSEQCRDETPSAVEQMLGFPAQWRAVHLGHEEDAIDACPSDALVWVQCDGLESDGYPGVRAIELMERRGVPFLGCSSAFYRATEAKLAMKREFLRHHVPTPDFIPLFPETYIQDLRSVWPGSSSQYLLKLDRGYGSAGLDLASLCASPEDAHRHFRRVALDGERFFLERFLDGPQASVLCLGSCAETMTYPPLFYEFAENVPLTRRYVTWEDSLTPFHDNSHIRHRAWPASRLAEQAAVEGLARRAYQAVGGCGWGRVDLRQDSVTGEWLVLEVNAQPSFGPESTTADILHYAQISGESFWRDFVRLGLIRPERDAKGAEILQADFLPGIALARDPDSGRSLVSTRAWKEGETVGELQLHWAGVEEAEREHWCHACWNYREQAEEADGWMVCPQCAAVAWCGPECGLNDALAHQASGECAALGRWMHALREDRWPVDAGAYLRLLVAVMTRAQEHDEVHLELDDYCDLMGFMRPESVYSWLRWGRFVAEQILDGVYPLNRVLQRIAQLECNEMGLPPATAPDRQIVAALGDAWTLLNHSCSPNLERQAVPGRRLRMVALRSIAAGEPLTLAYGVDESWPLLFRQRLLRDYFGFVCACTACVEGRTENLQDAAPLCASRFFSLLDDAREVDYTYSHDTKLVSRRILTT